LTTTNEETTMAPNEAARHHLYEQARTTWDDDAARTLMTALPWDPAEFATKQDLRELRFEMQAGFERSLRLTVIAIVTVQVAALSALLAVLPALT
jgi:hypothetical protein